MGGSDFCVKLLQLNCIPCHCFIRQLKKKIIKNMNMVSAWLSLHSSQPVCTRQEGKKKRLKVAVVVGEFGKFSFV